MSDFTHGWSVGHGEGGRVVVHVYSADCGNITLGLPPSSAEAMATLLLMATKAQREFLERNEGGGDD